MSRVALLCVVAFSVISTRAASGQAAAEYRARVDTLAKIWRPLVTAENAAKVIAASAAALPKDSVRVGPIIVRADSQDVALGRAAAERLAPSVERRYGRFADRLSRHQFVIRDR